jgi:EAL domain-containing protein (putative c-di-GMP-specific phosphodiesterase class I)
MAAVAKGVETDVQREFLITHGAPLAQGFLLGRPLPASEMAALVRGV